MAINWNLLNERTAGYRSLIEFKSKQQKTVDLKFSGLRVTLTELEKFLPPDAIFLGIWVDTLVIDSASFNANAVSIFARNIEITTAAAQGISLPAPKTQDPAVAQFFAGGVADGKSLNVIYNTGDQAKALNYSVPALPDQPQVITVVLNQNGSYNIDTDKTYGAFKDMINRPLAFNSLKASYMAATELINNGADDALETARQMLRWVVSTVNLLTTDGNTIPGDYAELFCQASATLGTINVKANAYYVPALAGDYYEKQAGRMLDALQSYQNDLGTLTTAQNISAAVGTVAANLEAVSNIQREPLQTDMDNIVHNANQLGQSIQDLRAQWDLNAVIAQGRMVKLYDAIRDANLKRYLQAFVETVVNLGQTVYGIAKLAEGSPDAKAGDVLKSGWETVKSIHAMYKAATAEVKPDGLVNAATELINAQRSLADSFISSSGIWLELKNGQPISRWPQASTADVFDPELTWNLYMIEAERILTNLNNSPNIGTDSYAGAPQEAATNYYAVLRVLAQYGKAIGSKMVAYSQLLVSAIKLRTEMEANKKIQDNWNLLSSRSNSDQEKLAALQGVLKSRMDAIRRSLFVAWTNYRNSYLYLYFETPPANTRITTDMSVPQLREAMVNVATWVGNLLAPASNKDRIVLPNQNVEVTFRFPVVRNTDNAEIKTTPAYFTAATDSGPASLTVNIPRDTTQLQGILPYGAQIPIWVRSAQFFVKGAKANDKGKIILNASTSGTYQNGFPPARMFRFENQGVEATFGYTAGNGEVYIEWDVNPGVYMTPTPFTMWRIIFDEDGGSAVDATELEIVFNVTFLAKKA